MRLSISLWFAALLAAETGGLTALPSMYQDSNQLSAADAGFEPTHTWAGISGAWSIDTATFRSGTQSVRTTATTSSYITLSVTANARAYRVRFWVKSDGDPGSSAAVYAYLFDQTHGSTAFGCGGSAHRMSLAGGLPTWTQYDLCNLAFGHHHYGDTLRLRLYLTGNSNGVPVYFDDVELLPDLQPLIIYPTYPNYRGMVWPEQGTLLKWKAVVEPPAAYTVGNLKVQVQIVRASDGQIMTTVTYSSVAAVATSGPWAHFSVNSMQYDIAGLADGAYYLRGTLRRISDSALVYAYPDYKIVKEAPSVSRNDWNLWVDKDNRTWFRRTAESTGAPRFVHGAFFSIGGDAISSGFVRHAGGEDCCTAGNRNPDNHRKLAIGCTRRTLFVESVTRANPATFTVRQHGLENGNKYTISGATGGWAGLNGSYYWTGADHLGNMTVVDADHFTFPLDSSAYPAWDQTNVTLLRGTCEVDGTANDDTALTWWDRKFGMDHSNLIKILGDLGINTLIRYGNFASANGGTSNSPPTCPYSSTYDDLSGWLTALQDVNAWHLQITNHYNRGDIPIQSGYAWYECCPGCSNEQNVRYAVRELATRKPMRDGFMGLYVADEPVNFGLDQWGGDQNIARAWPMTDEHRALNRGGVTYWASTSSGQATMQWNAFVDAQGIDPYPVGAGALGDDYAYGMASGKKHGRSYNWPYALGSAAFHSRPVWTVIQLWKQGGQWPTLADHKIQIVSALAAGTTGIIWWQMGAPSSAIVALSQMTQAEYDSFSAAAKKIAEWMPILSEPIQDLAGRQDGESDYGRLISTVSDAAIKCSSRQKGSRILLACANTTTGQKSVTITLRNAIPGKVERAWDGSLIAPSGPSFTDTFLGLQDASAPQDSVHLYLIDMQTTGMVIRPSW